VRRCDMKNDGKIKEEFFESNIKSFWINFFWLDF
jgi:hypothetical protein